MADCYKCAVPTSETVVYINVDGAQEPFCAQCYQEACEFITDYMNDQDDDEYGEFSYA